MTDNTAAIAALHRMIDSMGSALAPIVSAHVESEKAHAEKLGAQVLLVNKILGLATEIVHAIGTRPKIFESMGRQGGRKTTERLATWRGLVLTCRPREALQDRGLDPIQIETRLNGRCQGTYTGSHVFLHEDGRLVELSYEGSWDEPTMHDVAHDEWRATERETSVEAFCRARPSDADPKKVAAQLLKFIEKAGDRHKAIEKARMLTDKYRAVVALL